MAEACAPPPSVRVLEAGIVGSLDYKIILAERADDLYQWLKDNGYSYGGDEATLDFYIKKKYITVMKNDPHPDEKECRRLLHWRCHAHAFHIRFRQPPLTRSKSRNSASKTKPKPFL